MNPKVLLVTTVRWPSAARLAGAFSQCGCVVDAFLPDAHPAAESLYIEQRFTYRPLAARQSLLRAIAASEPDILIPCDDRAVELLLALHASAEKNKSGIKALLQTSLGNLDAYKTLMARDEFIKQCQLLGIRVPRSFALNSEADTEKALDAFGLPAAIKTDSSWGGDGVALVSTRDEAREAYSRLSRKPSFVKNLGRSARRSDPQHVLDAVRSGRPKVSIQEFVSGTSVTSVFSAWEGRCLATAHLEVVIAQDATGPSCVLKRIPSPEGDCAAAKIAEHFGLSGLHGLDFIRDAAGNMHLIEINPRATQSSYISFGPGQDIVAALAERLTGVSVAPRKKISSDLIALFPQEWMRDPASPYLTCAYHDVPWEDPALVRAWVSLPSLSAPRPFRADRSADIEDEETPAAHPLRLVRDAGRG